jgi:hypothetical protein
MEAALAMADLAVVAGADVETLARGILLAAVHLALRICDGPVVAGWLRHVAAGVEEQFEPVVGELG